MAKALFAAGIKELNKGPEKGPGNQAHQAASSFLLTLMSVEAFRVALFEGLGLKVGPGSKLSCLSDFTFLSADNSKQQRKQSDRPNGLLYLQTSKFVWSALMVTRVSGGELEADALANCVEIAKQNQVNAILTVCDTFTARPGVLPVNIEKTSVENLEIFHLPWGRIYTVTKQVLLSNADLSADDRARLSDFIAYMEDKTECLKADQRLQAETSAIARLVRSGAAIDPADTEVLNIVASWHQNLKFLNFKLREQFNCDVSVSGGDPLIAQSKDQLMQDAVKFSQSHQLPGAFVIGKGAATIFLKIDLLRRTANYSMDVSSNVESRKPTNPLTTILKKLKNSEPADIYIKAVYAGAAVPKQAPLEMVSRDPEILSTDQAKAAPEAYEVLMVRDIAGDLDDMDLLVKQIDDGLLSFYEHVVQNFSSQPPRNGASARKTKPPVAAPVQAANENMETGGSQTPKQNRADVTEKSGEATGPENLSETHTATIDDTDEDFSANRLVEILGKLETFSKR